MSKKYALQILQDTINIEKPAPSYKNYETIVDSTLRMAEYIGRIEASIQMAINELK